MDGFLHFPPWSWGALSYLIQANIVRLRLSMNDAGVVAVVDL